MSGAPDPIQRRRAWISAALVFGALLLVPLLALIAIPSPPKIQIPTTFAVEEAPPPPPRKPAPTAEAPKPRATATETEKPADAPTAVHGRVVGPDHEPIARALVGCTEKELNAVTDADGAFDLPMEADGCNAIAHKPGYGSSAALKLAAGNVRANLLVMRAGGRIEGVVVDDQSRPVAKYQIAVEKFLGADGDDEGSRGRSQSVDNEKGEFKMEGMTPGKYVLSASTEGRPPARSELFEVESGRAATGVRIVIARGGSVAGTVTDAATRQPIAGARVDLESQIVNGSGSSPTATTDASGKYTLDGVPTTGPFSVRVSKDGYRTRIVSGINASPSSQATADAALVTKTEGGGDSEFGGIGAVLGPAPGAMGAMVLATTKGGPAERGGVLAQDRILKIDGTPTDTLTITECIQRVRGEPGSTVTLWLKRGDTEVQISLVRDTVVR
ncbi:MAG: carboxypeptidase regulatory-like domain-containing protein [Polyangiaceae bacterium]